MIDALITLAMVAPQVTPPPPVPAAPIADCKYSAMINNDRSKPIYKCYTEQEWQQKEADEAAAAAQQQAEAQVFWAKHWWLIIIGFALILIFLLLLMAW